ncbi:MAG TPA: class I SAM-dependent methyltransferase [Mycobacteriales bacterium]|jgi:SAM-dependent methyltransferase|nr:class I SAM-dependent methyltransferase [Mycobacteriales bacterium]
MESICEHEPTPAARWRAELAAWQIPESILAKAPESPYGFPVGMFRADPEPLVSASRDRALEMLPNNGTVLDVGCGGGRASLALVPPAGRVIGVDSLPEMLASFARAAHLGGVDHHEVLGTWPAVAGAAGMADIVVAHHVAYNIPDLGEFALALSRAARRRVVLEMTGAHPWVPTNELWQKFHDLERPTGPTASLAAAVLRDCGLPIRLHTWHRPPRPASRADTVSFIRRRLCLPESRDRDVDGALPADYEFSQREVATLWWDCAK